MKHSFIHCTFSSTIKGVDRSREEGATTKQGQKSHARGERAVFYYKVHLLSRNIDPMPWFSSSNAFMLFSGWFQNRNERRRTCHRSKAFNSMGQGWSHVQRPWIMISQKWLGRELGDPFFKSMFCGKTLEAKGFFSGNQIAAVLGSFYWAFIWTSWPRSAAWLCWAIYHQYLYKSSLLAPSGALIAIPTNYWSTTPLFQITPVLNTGLSLSEPVQLYKGYNAI